MITSRNKQRYNQIYVPQIRLFQPRITNWIIEQWKSFLTLLVKVMWHTAKYGDPYSKFVLCIYPSKCTHTAVNTHKPWTHTWSSGQPFLLWCLGSSCGFGALLKGTSVVVLRVERALYIHSPHLQSLPDRDLNSQPFDYESDSLSLGHDFPLVCISEYECICYCCTI